MFPGTYRREEQETSTGPGRGWPCTRVCASKWMEGAMEIGTQKWHESASDMGWEVLALAGCLMQAAILAIIIAIVRLVN